MSAAILEMPKNYKMMDNEEMEYIEGGGYYLTNNECWDLAATIGISATATVAIAAGAIAAGGGTLAGSLILAFPPLAPVAGYLAAIIVRSSLNLGDGLVKALATGKGMELNFEWGIVPTVTATVR